MNAEEVAHKLTDGELAKLERKIAKVYKQAGEEIESKLADYMARFNKADAAKLAQLADGKITQAQYSAWRQNEMMLPEQWQRMRDTLAQDYVNADKIAAKIINGEMPNVYALNHNYAAYALESGTNMNLQFTLYDKATVEGLLKENKNLLPQRKIDVPKDLRWNKQKIQSAVTQGILQGEPIDKIADRLQQVTDMNKSAAIRNARTATTGAENAGRQDTYNEAVSKGIKLKKEWLATLDSRTRDAHQQLDGQQVAEDEPFKSEFGDIMYPGDPSADPANVYNCRCTMVAVVDGVEDVEPVYRRDNISGELIKDMPYKDWEKYKSAQIQTKDYSKYKSNLPDINGKEDIVKYFDGMSESEKENWSDFQSKTDYKVFDRTEDSNIENFNPSSGEVTLFRDSTADTYFHETAHAIDRTSVEMTNEFTGSRKRVGSDEWVDAKPSSYSFNGASNAADQIYRFNENAWQEDNDAWFKWSGMKDEDDLSSLLDSLREFEKQYGETAASVLSDMIDAQTLGKYPLSFVSGGHGEAYWKSSADRAAAESWAEFVSLKAQGKTKAIDAMLDILPNRISSNKTMYDVVFGGEKYEHVISTESRTRISKETWKIKRS